MPSKHLPDSEQHMSQFTFNIKDKRRSPKRNDKPVRVVHNNPAIPALNQEQAEWAIGHNLQWLLSIVQGNEVRQ